MSTMASANFSRSLGGQEDRTQHCLSRNEDRPHPHLWHLVQVDLRDLHDQVVCPNPSTVPFRSISHMSHETGSLRNAPEPWRVRYRMLSHMQAKMIGEKLDEGVGAGCWGQCLGPPLTQFGVPLPNFGLEHAHHRFNEPSVPGRPGGRACRICHPRSRSGDRLPVRP